MDWLMDAATSYLQTYLGAVLVVCCLWSSAGYGGGGIRPSDNLHYAIHEERDSGVKIADIVTDAGLHEYGVDVIALLRFKFLNQPICRIAIDERTGIIWTSGRIDRETVCRTSDASCQVRLDVVVQPMTYFQIVKVSVDILDVNDNNPVFSPSSAAHEMLESAPIGLSLPLPSAVDLDTSAFAVRRYELVGGGGPQRPQTLLFELKELRKPDGSTDLRLVLVDALDREREATHRFTVFAYDGGEPPRRGSLNVTISVLDVNDNAPAFDRESYLVTITENCPIHATVLRVRATDRDVGRNAELTYFLGVSTSQNFGDTFRVDNSTGEIVVIGVVDYETTPVYQLMVSVRDNGPDPVSADAMVTIRVQDSNDNAPQITVNTLVASDTRSAPVPENATVGTFVGHVTVKDPDGDVSGSVNCSLSGDDAFELRQTYESEYQIVTAVKSLDRESRASYDLKILCKDGGRPQMTSSRHVIIDVTDINDNAPSFSRPFYSAEIEENNPIGSIVIRITATDPDSEDNADIVYSLLDPDDVSAPSSSFDIHPRQGVVRAAVSLDHELKARHRVTLMAVDRGVPARTGTAVLEVDVVDVNDERPEFLPGTLMMSVRENQPSGTSVGTLRAVDADTHPYNAFSFGLPASSSPTATDVNAPTPPPPFAVDPKSGKIVTTRILDREKRDGYYLTTTVTDDGNRSLSSTATVTIVVQDVNDNPPVFAHPSAADANLSVAIFNRALKGHVVTRLRATDRDAGKNGHVMYSIEKGGSDEDDDGGRTMFRINSTSGVISLDVDLKGDRDNQIIVLRAMAFDRGIPRLSSIVDLTIIINRSTELPLGLRNTAAPPSSASSSPSPSSSQSSQGLLNTQLVIAAVGGSFALLAVLAAFSIGLLLVWRRHRRKRRYNDRKDRAVKALTLSSEEVKLSGEDTTPPPLSERTRDHHHDLCGQALLLKGTADDEVMVCVKPDILSRSPRRLRPEGRQCDDSVGVGRKSRDEDEEEDDDDVNNDVEKDVVTSVDCDSVTHRSGRNQVHCPMNQDSSQPTTTLTTTMTCPVTTGATQRPACNGQNYCVSKILGSINHSPATTNPLSSLSRPPKAFTKPASSVSGTAPPQPPSVPMDIWVPRTELEPSAPSAPPSPSDGQSVVLTPTNSLSTFKQNRPSPILSPSGLHCNSLQGNNNSTKLTSMV